MALNVFTLDDSLSWFLELNRIDPITRSRYERGDRVVVCRACKMVHLESTWQDCGGCVAPGCNGKETAARFIKAPPPKPPVPHMAINHIRLTNSRVERQDEAANGTTDTNGQPRMIIRARHYNHS